jgi:transglycosylase-like protein with SLT domain
MQAVQALRAFCVLALILRSASMVAFAQHAAPGQTGLVPTGDVTEPRDEDKPSAQSSAETGRDKDTEQSLCLIIESAAKANDLPLEFLARVIWQESRFQSDAVGPVTSHGGRAQGIAQFMPETARERGLLDPFDPVQALPKAAEFLNELRNQFGNLGLAAAAYNAGSAAGAGMAGWIRKHAPRDTQLRARDHWHDYRGLGHGRQG